MKPNSVIDYILILLGPFLIASALFISVVMGWCGYKWEIYGSGNVGYLLLTIYVLALVGSLISIIPTVSAIKMWKRFSEKRTVGYSIAITTSVLYNAGIIALVIFFQLPR